jgi:hypothetical protein
VTMVAQVHVSGHRRVSAMRHKRTLHNIFEYSLR